jgi:uncharacterized membrane protein
METPMAMPTPVVWVLTITFTLTGAYCLARCGHFVSSGRNHPVSGWATELAHLAMSAAMVGVLWSTRSWDRHGIQLTVFALLAGWFAVRAVVGPPSDRLPGPVASRPALLHETVGFAAMCWMLLGTMGPVQGATVGSNAATVMSMSGTGLAPHMTTTVSAGLAAALTVGCGGWAWELRKAVGAAPPRPPAEAVFGRAGEAACQIAMAAAMVIALVVTL